MRKLLLAAAIALAPAAVLAANDGPGPNLVIEVADAQGNAKGTITLDLFADVAPGHVERLVTLAREGAYDGVVFHRVIEGFMAQTGDPTGSGMGGPGYRFEDEFGSDKRHSGKGVLSMANAGPGTNGSQFFITFTDTPHLDGRHTVFGQVVDGLDVLDRLKRIQPGMPGEADVIEKAYLIEK